MWIIFFLYSAPCHHQIQYNLEHFKVDRGI
jgi:hypothetical protein